ncbi:DUF805 domain-containing protein [Apilactobacillus timberlakei]|uniref:DUF805 domain-containing protein n=1 Tax=Apilactobacillus timberlakei TaxID=2008380 RepID=UPI00112B365A|nr:DUF805 domain-containing protein [Apilactobacillus timberlakei]TPR19489.1 DUF805 domain-containing protein [Apilactobacillus timberlakei]TPR20466.1 DUF805 domain-containing protein [Apilactobacillus timberlakei]TPR22510.1 DUF805 domain-containing protein [Apilactobacillus timberlakei]
MNSYLKFWKNAFNYKGRTNIKDFWIPQLFHILLIFIFLIMDYFTNGNKLFVLFNVIIIVYLIIILVPTIFMMIRRYRDVGIPIYYLFILLIGSIILTGFPDNTKMHYVGRLVHLINLWILIKPTKKLSNK